MLAAERNRYRTGRVRLLAPVSPGVERELSRFYPGIPTHLTPNGVDLTRFRPDDEARRDMRGSRGLRDEDLVALFVGGDWARKGLRHAIEGVADARARGFPVRLWVVGRGDASAERRFAASRGVEPWVSFYPPDGHVQRYYQAADVFVFPTTYETFSLVCYEAAASQLPVIATLTNGIEDLIADEHCGIPVTPDGASVSSALVDLAQNPGQRRQLGEAARQRASEFGWDRSAAAAAHAYERLLSKRT